eukprot:7833571-Pyramimonas_sp.AAC.1
MQLPWAIGHTRFPHALLQHHIALLSLTFPHLPLLLSSFSSSSPRLAVKPTAHVAQRASCSQRAGPQRSIGRPRGAIEALLGRGIHEDLTTGIVVAQLAERARSSICRVLAEVTGPAVHPAEPAAHGQLP